MQTIITIGVYGFTESGFFSALQNAGVDTFCDIRYRRAVRGAQYSFTNSRRLQKRLEELRIRYFHFRELAPSPELRQRQTMADRAARTAKRQRTELSPDFIRGYQQECLHHFVSHVFLDRIGAQAQVVALFCVETEPAACHRSLLGERLHTDCNVEIVHLKPS